MFTDTATYGRSQSQQVLPARALPLILWVGFMALIRGFSEIVLAFELRSERSKEVGT